jgi:hypothetical protein
MKYIYLIFQTLLESYLYNIPSMSSNMQERKNHSVFDVSRSLFSIQFIAQIFDRELGSLEGRHGVVEKSLGINSVSG